MNITSLFVCPQCKFDFIKNEGNYACIKCHKNYPIVNDIPIFLTDQNESNVMNKFWDDGWKIELKILTMSS